MAPFKGKKSAAASATPTWATRKEAAAGGSGDQRPASEGGSTHVPQQGSGQEPSAEEQPPEEQPAELSGEDHMRIDQVRSRAPLAGFCPRSQWRHR